MEVFVQLKIPLLSKIEMETMLEQQAHRYPRTYGAMYSSWWGGITTSLAGMLVPIDDHLVHRGDGVFEAFRIAQGAFYDLRAHLQRLSYSAEALGIVLPNSLYDIEEICRQTAIAANLREGMVRLFVSRGPGGFTTNPYESVGSQLYVVVTPFQAVPATKYENGVKALLSRVAVKENPYCGIKSCNYLPNVMMKKEAVDLNVDYTLSVDSDGALAEGSTENFFLVTKSQELIAPLFQRTLRGTTLIRVMQLAEQLKSEGLLRSIRQDRVCVEDLYEASEANLAGTTIGVLPLVEFDHRNVGTGKPGPVGASLRRLLSIDMNENPDMRSLIY
jgi:branched-chain amino acid aminotransferase